MACDTNGNRGMAQAKVLEVKEARKKNPRKERTEEVDKRDSKIGPDTGFGHDSGCLVLRIVGNGPFFYWRL